VPLLPSLSIFVYPRYFLSWEYRYQLKLTKKSKNYKKSKKVILLKQKVFYYPKKNFLLFTIY